MALSHPRRHQRQKSSRLPFLEPLEVRSLLSAVIALTGNGTSIANGDTTPLLADFTDFGDMSTTPTAAIGNVTRTYQIANNGDQDLTLTGSPNLVVVSGANATDFLVTSDASSLDIAAGDSASFTITFLPQAAGLRQAVVTVSSNDPNTPAFSFDIQGTGLNTTDSPDGLQVATTTPGSGSAAISGSDLTVNYTGYLTTGTIIASSDPSINPGRTPLELVLGRNSVIQGWEEGLLGIQAGETRTLIIPASLGYGSNDNGAIPANSPLIFTLSAISVVQPAIAVSGNGHAIANGQAAPASGNFTDFGPMSTTVGTLGTVTRTFVINDPSSGDLNLTGSPNPITITGTNAADFAVTVNPITTIDAASSSSFTISFTPQDVGLRQAVVTIPSTDPTQPNYTFDIQGTGLNTTNASNGLMSFTTTLGSGLAAISRSNVALNYTGTLFDGTVFGSALDPNAPLNVVPVNPNVLPGLTQGLLGVQPGQALTLIIPAALAYGSNANGNIPADSPLIYTINVLSVHAPAVSMTVTGNGQNIANGDTTSTLTDFTNFGYMSTTANATIGTVTRTFLVNDVGGLDLSLVGSPKLVALTGANAADFVVTTAPNAAVTAGSSSAFIITFAPHGTGVRKATVTILSNDPTHPSFSFSIQGTGVATTTAGDGLMSATLKAGAGTAAIAGSLLSINYTGWLTTGTIFDSSDPTINPGRTPLSLTLGIGQGIAGWDQGLLGIKPGETRLLIIPAALAYGSNASGLIPANSPLIFTVSDISNVLPLVTVSGNGVNIANGDKSPSTADYTNFRFFTTTPDPTNGTCSRDFTLTNVGGASTALMGNNPVTISGANAADFTVAAQPGSDLAGGAPETFTIDFLPLGTGTRTATVTIHVNDSQRANFTFTIQGTGLATINNTTNHLQIVTLQAGTGAGAVVGTSSASSTTVVLDYTAFRLDGVVFDQSTYESAILPGHSPIQIVVGNAAGALPLGMDMGLVGIKPGETRAILIPSTLSYIEGQQPSSGDIPMIMSVTRLQGPVLAIVGGPTFQGIAFGEKSPSTANGTDFGSIIAGSTSSTLTSTFNLEGLGSAAELSTLNLTSLQLPFTGTNASNFTATFFNNTTSGIGWTVTFTGTKPGTYSAVANAGSTDVNHPDFQFTVSAEVVPWVDLTAAVGNINFPASNSLISGAAASYTIPVSITNGGNTAVPATASACNFLVYLHNTTDGANHAHDILLSNSTTTALRSLAAGKSKSVSLSTPIPITVNSGTYQIVVQFNTNGAIPESTTSNNTATSARIVTITQGFYDLAASIGSTNFAAGTPIISGAATLYKIPLTITNTGNLPIASNAAPVEYDVYLHNTAGGADTLLASSTSTGLRNLAVGKSSQVSLSVALPITVPAGTFEFRVMVDANAAIPESTLLNNNATSSQTFNVTQGFYNISGNLSTSTFTAAIAAHAPLSGKLTATIKNSGNLTLPSTQKITAQLVAIAPDQTLIPIGTASTATLFSLLPGKSTALTLAKSLLAGLTAGTYELAIQIAPVPFLNQNTADDLIQQTPTAGTFTLTVT